MDQKKLFDNEDTFFKTYCRNLTSTIGKDVLDNFGRMKTDEERIRFVNDEVVPKNELEIKWLTNGKDFEEAKRLKEAGNKSFAAGDNKEALKFYTGSLSKMPYEQNTISDLAVLFANRSACLYHMSKYEHALRDIDNALSLDYPKHLAYKVHERKARCLLAQQKNKDAIGEFRITLQALDDAKLPGEKKKKIETDIQIMLSVMGKSKNESANVEKPKKKDPEPQLCTANHKVYESACDKIEILEEEEVGRFAAAAKDIEPGEVLLIEKPYCSVLLGEFSTTHCHHCFVRIQTLYPCKSCNGASFCSKKCQQDACESYHKYECPILATVLSSGASVTVLMALRIITQNPFDFFLRQKDSLHTSQKVFSTYQSADYRTVYHLVRHEHLRRTDDFFERTLMAWFLLQCLKKSNYFPIDAKSDDQLFIGSLILRHMQILQFNAHEIFELELKKGQKLDNARSVFIGGGIFSTLSLFNHSCDPGVVRYFRGTTTVVRAIKPIEKGEIIAENYGPIFTVMEREERRDKLKSQYWFDCLCVACRENWPRLEDMHSYILGFRCDLRRDDGGRSNTCKCVIPVPQNTNDFMATCPSCRQQKNILKGLKILQDTDAMYRQASRDADAGNYQAALGIYLEILSMLYSVLAPPFKDYHLCQQAIRTCMLCYGNKYVKDDENT